MTEAKQQDDWQHTASLLALQANCHRDPKKGSPFKPGDFDPFQQKSSVLPGDITDLKLLLKDKGENRDG